MFDMQGYIIYVVLYFVIWLEFISESYFYVPTINKVFNNNNNNNSFLNGGESFRFVLQMASGQYEHDTYPQQKSFRNDIYP